MSTSGERSLGPCALLLTCLLAACDGSMPPLLQGPPRIVAVTAAFNGPLLESDHVAVYSGMPVTIFAELKTGAYPLETSWEFGGGAEPEHEPRAASDHPEPTPRVSVSIVPGAPGTYPSSVTVSNAQGSDSFEFTLEVSTPPLPDVDPLGYLPGPLYSGEFGYISRREGDGLIADWSWNFGGGADPNTLADDHGTITFGAAGSYSASLTVSNPGGTLTIPFTLQVVPLAPPQLEIRRDHVWFVGNVEAMQAHNSGGPADSWVWDFGGAAESDNIVERQFPTAIGGTPGLYHGTVTASNEAGSDTAEFRILVQHRH